MKNTQIMKNTMKRQQTVKIPDWLLALYNKTGMEVRTSLRIKK